MPAKKKPRGKHLTPEEKEQFSNYLARAKNRETAFVDALWALLNTREFILNH